LVSFILISLRVASPQLAMKGRPRDSPKALHLKTSIQNIQQESHSQVRRTVKMMMAVSAPLILAQLVMMAGTANMATLG